MMNERLKDRFGYEAIEKYDTERLAKLQEHYTAILELLGEDPKREGLQKTPLRVARSMQFLTQGYEQDPMEILLSAKFKEVFTQVFLSGETVVLCIFKGNYYQHTDMSYEEVKQNEAASFLDDWKDDEEEFGHGEQTELENDGQQ